MVVYHGTNTNIDAFDAERIGSNSGDYGTAGKGFYFTADRENAETIARVAAKENGGEPIVIPVYLNIRNPKTGVDIMETDGSNSKAEKFTQKAKEQGYDGIEATRGYGRNAFHWYVAFDPKQIKSAEANSGEFGGTPGIRFSIRKEKAPKKTGIGYKVFVLKDGKLYPPMVANPGGEDTPVGVWLNADAAPVAGESKTGRLQVKAGGKGTQGGSGRLAYRPGWHLGEIPYALQFNRINPETGEKQLFPNNFVWAEVEYANDVDYQKEAMDAGKNAHGKFQHSLAGLPRVPENGSYKYRTNPNPETDPWIITGAMKVNRILPPSEVDEMVRAAGREPQQRQEGAVTDEQVAALNEKFPKYRFLGEKGAKNLDAAEERRASLAAETEDVAREDQIFLQNNLGSPTESLSLSRATDEVRADSEDGRAIFEEDVQRMHEVAPNAMEALVAVSPAEIVDGLQQDLGTIQLAQVVQASRNPNVLAMYSPTAKKVIVLPKHGTSKEMRDANWHENFHYAIDMALDKSEAGRAQMERAAKAVDRLDPKLAAWIDETYKGNDNAEEKIVHAMESVISYMEDKGKTQALRAGLDFGDDDLNEIANKGAWFNSDGCD